MQPFPVINATLSPDALSKWIKDKYGFHNVECRLFRTNMNDTYMVVADEGKYVLRVYNQKYRTHQHVVEEAALLELLKTNDINVSYPVADLENNYVNEVLAPEGLRQTVLFSFAEGKTIRFPTLEHCKNLGELMGRMHCVTIDRRMERMEYSVEQLAGWAYEQAKKYFSEDLEEMRFMKEWHSLLAKAFSDTTPRRGIVHLDMWYANMCIDDNDKITLFDFDNCGTGWLVLDIGYACLQLFNVEQEKQVYEQKKKALIQGYRSVMDVTDKELELIPYAGAAIWVYYLGLQAERFDYFANIFLTENYLKMFIGRAKDWLTYNGVNLQCVC